MSQALIEEVREVSEELVDAFARLMPQLSSSSPAPSAEWLEKLVKNPNNVLFVARLDGEIVGSLTLVFVMIPTGLRAWIEDVVVDEAARGNGIGGMLCEAAIDRSLAGGAKKLDLTSRPVRGEANRLYPRVGFVLRETNVYRYDPAARGSHAGG